MTIKKHNFKKSDDECTCFFGRSGGLFVASPPPKVKNFIRASFHFSTSGCGLFTAIPNANTITKQSQMGNYELQSQL